MKTARLQHHRSRFTETRPGWDTSSTFDSSPSCQACIHVPSIHLFCIVHLYIGTVMKYIQGNQIELCMKTARLQHHRSRFTETRPGWDTSSTFDSSPSCQACIHVPSIHLITIVDLYIGNVIKYIQGNQIEPAGIDTHKLLVLLALEGVKC
jgi:hypothetical protein